MTAFSNAEIAHTLSQLHVWNQLEFEIPDVVAFADYLSSPCDLDTLRRLDFSAGQIDLFPWSDGGKIRQLSVLNCVDLVAYTIAAAHIAATTDPLLSEDVFSARLAKGPPRWAIRRLKKQYPRFRERALALLTSRACSAMGVEDVENYFGSITTEVLIGFLASRKCDREAIKWVGFHLGRWQSAGLVGLPIGPDASRLLGNTLLWPMDCAIKAVGVTHLRWMDDSLLLGRSLSQCRDGSAAAERALSSLKLRFKQDKRREFEDPEEAVAYIRDEFIASLAAQQSGCPQRFREAAERAWIEFAARDTGPTPKHFRYVLNRLLDAHSKIAVSDLVGDPKLANVDARASCDYLIAAGLTDRDKHRVFDFLEGPHADLYDGLSLNLIRALGARTGGVDAGRVLRGIAMDRSRRAPVREWAWMRWAGTDDWNEKVLLDATEAEEDPRVRRAALAPLRGRQSLRRDLFLRDFVTRFPEIEPMAHWVQGVAA